MAFGSNLGWSGTGPGIYIYDEALARTRAHDRIGVRVRADIIGHLKSCMTDIYLYIDARTADYIHTHPYVMHLLH